MYSARVVDRSARARSGRTCGSLRWIPAPVGLCNGNFTQQNHNIYAGKKTKRLMKMHLLEKVELRAQLESCQVHGRGPDVTRRLWATWDLAAVTGFVRRRCPNKSTTQQVQSTYIPGQHSMHSFDSWNNKQRLTQPVGSVSSICSPRIPF